MMFWSSDLYEVKCIHDFYQMINSMQDFVTELSEWFVLLNVQASLDN